MLQHQRHSVEAMRSLCQKMRRRVYENWTGLMYKKGISVDVANPLYVKCYRLLPYQSLAELLQLLLR